MHKKLLALLFIIAICTGCENNSPPTIPAVKDSTHQTFFPVTDYIRGQLSEIDSLPVTPLKIISTNGKDDSVWVKKEDVRPFAEPFLHPQIDTANLKHLYNQRSFLDQTINAYTFSYDPVDKLPDTLPLIRWDVYIDPEKGTVKRIFIIKEFAEMNGSKKTLQLTWFSSRWCKITTITEQEGKQPVIKEETIKWDLRE